LAKDALLAPANDTQDMTQLATTTCLLRSPKTQKVLHTLLSMFQ